MFEQMMQEAQGMIDEHDVRKREMTGGDVAAMIVLLKEKKAAHLLQAVNMASVLSYWSRESWPMVVDDWLNVAENAEKWTGKRHLEVVKSDGKIIGSGDEFNGYQEVKNEPGPFDDSEQSTVTKAEVQEFTDKITKG